MPTLLEIFLTRYDFQTNLQPLQRTERMVDRLERRILRTTPAVASTETAFGRLNARLRTTNRLLGQTVGHLAALRALSRAGIGETRWALDRVLGRAPEQQIRRLLGAAPALGTYTAQLQNFGRVYRQLPRLNRNRPLPLLPPIGGTTRPASGTSPAADSSPTAWCAACNVRHRRWERSPRN